MSPASNTIAEVLVEFDAPITAEDGGAWRGRVMGTPNALGHWEGWIEFANAASAAKDLTWLPTERETTQPNRADLSYWATGLTVVYLQGALSRARSRGRPRPAPSGPTLVSSRGPAPHQPAAAPAATAHAVLDPFAVYAQGEQVLRSELRALSVDHLQRIATAYQMDVGAGSRADLAERIVIAVKNATPGG